MLTSFRPALLSLVDPGEVVHVGIALLSSQVRTRSYDIEKARSVASSRQRSSNRELGSSTAGPGLCLSLHLSALSAARHDDVVVVSYVE